MGLSGILAEVFSWLILVMGVSWGIALTMPLVLGRISSIAPANQIRLLMALAWFPVVCASCALWAYRIPTVSHWLVDDHCHAGYCGPHDLYLPVSSGFSVALLLVALLVASVAVGVALRQLITNRRFSDALNLMSESVSKAHYRVVTSDIPSAWCAGLLRPQVFVSSGLVNKLTALELRLVLLHELSHVQNLDNLRRLIVRWLAVAWPSNVRRLLLRHLQNAMELRSDLYALNTANVKDNPSLLPLTTCQEGDHNGNTQARLQALLTQLHSPMSTSTMALIWLGLMGILLLLGGATVAIGHPLLELLMR